MQAAQQAPAAALAVPNVDFRPSKVFHMPTFIRHRLRSCRLTDNGGMNADALTRTLEEFLTEASGAIVLEDGAVIFDLAQARYSISGEHNKCLLHLWSAERNTVRRVLDAEAKNGMLRLAVQRLGQPHPSKLEICRERDRRSPTAKRAARTAYEAKLKRAMERNFPGFTISRLTTRSGEIVWPDLCARPAAARADSLRGAGRECFRDAEFDRCGLDFRNSVARRLPRIFCRKVPGRGPRSFCSRRFGGLGPRAHGELESGGTQMAIV